jgi:dTDP-4-amino-4,6-dideoxygalactose transaminase
MHKVGIPFNKPFAVGTEFSYIQQAIDSRHLSGNGMFTKKCQAWFESQIGCQKALLTHSCTAALEMAAILIDLQPGDEVIMPSYTFVSTANAFVLRGGVPVFVDIRPDTLNINQSKIEAAITPKTKAIVPVHYAGVGCEMDQIMALAQHYNLAVIEDAAQGFMATYNNRPLGSFGQLASVSFHETKNVICGEGGMLFINDPHFTDRAEIIWEKGTNRTQFFQGRVDKYTWVDVGSSYLPSDINAAFLWAQLEIAQTITEKRLYLWSLYHQLLEDLEVRGKIQRPIIPKNCNHNAHMYYILLQDMEIRSQLISTFKSQGISAVFHYVPLHSSPAGEKFGRISGNMSITDSLAGKLLRLPMFPTLTEQQIERVVTTLDKFFK